MRLQSIEVGMYMSQGGVLIPVTLLTTPLLSIPARARKNGLQSLPVQDTLMIHRLELVLTPPQAST